MTTDVCGSCSKAARYRCPACSFSSCSLQCSKNHKLSLSCSGVAPPIWSKPIPSKDFGWGELLRDQCYIATVGRYAEQIGRNLVEDKLIPDLKQLREEGDEGRLDTFAYKDGQLIKEARKEGVKVKLLSRGMLKRVENKSRYDFK